MLGTTRPTQLRTLAAALALTAGALLYFSDHDNLDRHWRIAVAMVLSATLLVIWPPVRPGRSAGAKVTLLIALVLGTGCSMRASHALMGTGLATATTGALATDTEGSLRSATISVGLAMFAVGWVLHQSDSVHGGTAPAQRIYTSIEPPRSSLGDDPTTGEKLGIYRRLPSDHGLFTR
jgi:hypothetical protein